MAPPKTRIHQTRLRFLDASPQSESTVSETPQVKKRKLRESDSSSLAEGLADLETQDGGWGVEPDGFISGLPDKGTSLQWITQKDLGSHVKRSSKEVEGEIILKRFDLDPTYGPSRGLTRTQRYERACRLGLQPPPIVREILAGLPEAFNVCTFDQKMGAHT
eukprot:Protomagalhaensia_sp_Gyna_25__390@NODE_1185_length_2087_cov_4_384766_g942_i0_p2_GENE_NODE_1185_length_2087_cov_4_384766_g942_i0NODE_1185_length_2087_cov_4_384766_g942_i0_p2_ORF_typecomplete_len162_score18_74DNA_pol_delta_4/PF04081_13/4_6e17_NODE_1185_length_2087_cov_4_384766_g942_i012181703